ncbi:tryptophan 2,3-dioxygenase family protein [Micromonospora sp. WMMA1363]|uniref:tryptophan 2,3-dioxygenase family protein n=1 Tax=Micromonospora sp. WMMA1363 TaxID=3053985 RepID=UPI00259D130D|nr:tryptophan 2,3-dioxygenase family protein [Micromonospora sp. WMMA1363]MDM4723309.1 tryptophan 2,3-dioxygenase family protein [Micromonospora sp. WMMA1363]
MSGVAEMVDEWLRGPRRADDYPHMAVMGEIQRTGKHFLSPDVVGALQRTWRELPAVQGSYAAGRRLRWWLDAVLDKADGRHCYRTYLALALLPLPTADDDTLIQDAASSLRYRDRVVVGLVADAMRFEGAASSLTMRPSPALTAKRIRLGWRVLEPIVRRLGLSQETVAGGYDPDDGWRRVAGELDEGERRALAWSMMPVSTVHDERLFIRLLQAWEATFAAVTVDLSAVVGLLEADRPHDAAGRLDAAARLLQESAPLFALAATMQVEAFHEFRRFTEGASAIQSHNYKLVESLCRRPELARLQSIAYDAAPRVRARVLAGEPTIDSQVRALRPETADEVMAPAMARFADALTSWRRTHYSLAVRMLAGEQGTGYTAGTPYLDQVRRAPVFNSTYPARHDDNGRRGGAE